MKKTLLFLVKIYQKCISPIMPKHCRYVPSCSEYAIEAINIHGCIRGGLLTIKRLLRCNPWGGHGYNPVPEKSDREKKDK